MRMLYAACGLRLAACAEAQSATSAALCACFVALLNKKMNDVFMIAFALSRLTTGLGAWQNTSPT
jgi:hypothetical protein